MCVHNLSISDNMDAAEGLSRRAWRALPLMVLALVVIAVTGVAYLHPSLPSFPKAAAPAKPAGPPLISDRYQVAYDFLTPTLGWALVVDQASSSPQFWVFRTTDMAKHWERQFTSPASISSAGPLKLQFFDRNNGLAALGGAAAVYRTADGGGHWTALAMPKLLLSSVFVSDPRHGWVIGSTGALDQIAFSLFSTSDGGDHWAALPQPPMWSFAGKGGFADLAFRRPSEGWMGGETPGSSTVYSTIDGGLTWQAHPLPVTTGKGGFVGGNAPLADTNVYLLPGAGVLAVTVDGSGNSVALTSFDGGTAWRRLPAPPGETTYADFTFQDNFNWWAMRFGTLFKSSDAGQSWKQVAQQLDEWDYVPQVVDGQRAWAQMNSNPANGTGLATTAAGGLHWNPVNVPNPS
jgi:photosystem II stability/assembly factor-like uncharacterized protein